MEKKVAKYSDSPALTDAQRAEFDARVEAYITGAQVIVDKNYERYDMLAGEKLTREDGGRFVRVWADTLVFIDQTDKSKGKKVHTYEGKPQRRIHTFIDTLTGDILKPATYKAPAKHARGNLFDPQNGLGTVNEHGPGYLR